MESSIEKTETQEKTHFVYPYIVPKDERFGWELMYSIRSIYKFFQGPFDITIVGEQPEWLNTEHPDCTFIYLDNSDPVLYPRVQFRSNEKLLKAAELYKSLVFIHDDMYFIKPVTLDEIKRPKYEADDMYYANTQEETKRLTMFQKQLRNASNILKAKGKPYIRNYASHCPMWYESKKLFQLSKLFPMVVKYGKESVVTEVAYYNYFKGSTGLEDQHSSEFRAGFWYDNNLGDLNRAKVLNHDERGYLANPWIKDYLDKLELVKSPLEKENNVHS